ncbi:MAG: cupin domain-containing protein [Myxococcales bacterium]|nr:cupin domain-containing protein [Myxococcales bacterium]
MRIVQKPWGYEEIWAETDRYAGKFLIIHQGGKLSRQYHERKDESICVLEGVLTLELGRGPDEVRLLAPGETYHILAGTVHRFCAESGPVRLAEVSTPELHDIVRLEDIYARVP